MTRPFVTCLCITRNRPNWLHLACDYFADQACYLAIERLNAFDTELLIVSDGERLNADDYARVNARIRVINLASRPRTLGEKRNIGCALADGDIIAAWDDDDYSSPRRIWDQLTMMKRSGKSVIAYNRMKFTDGKDWWMYDGSMLPSVGIGGSLLFTKSWWSNNPFDRETGADDGYGGFIAEDNDFIYRAFKRKQFIAMSGTRSDATAGLEDADMMYATIHKSNTSKRDTTPGGNYHYIGQSDVSRRVSDAFLATGRPL